MHESEVLSLILAARLKQEAELTMEVEYTARQVKISKALRMQAGRVWRDCRNWARRERQHCFSVHRNVCRLPNDY